MLFTIFLLVSSCSFLINSDLLIASKLTGSCNGKGRRSMGVRGLDPQTILNGQKLVVECTALL
jgi:hypothetical protein